MENTNAMRNGRASIMGLAHRHRVFPSAEAVRLVMMPGCSSQARLPWTDR